MPEQKTGNMHEWLRQRWNLWVSWSESSLIYWCIYRWRWWLGELKDSHSVLCCLYVFYTPCYIVVPFLHTPQTSLKKFSLTKRKQSKINQRWNKENKEVYCQNEPTFSQFSFFVFLFLHVFIRNKPRTLEKNWLNWSPEFSGAFILKTQYLQYFRKR